jgi:hypothetical protein
LILSLLSFTFYTVAVDKLFINQSMSSIAIRRVMFKTFPDVKNVVLKKVHRDQLKGEKLNYTYLAGIKMKQNEVQR